MKLSESLGHGIIRSGGGKIVNTFRGFKTRRNTLFFADILAQYIRRCEEAHEAQALAAIGRRWAILLIQELLPTSIRILPHPVQFNVVLKRVWTHIGLLEDLAFSRSGSVVRLTTTHEILRDLIGDNHYSTGSFEGILCGMFGTKITCREAHSENGRCDYVFDITGGSLALSPSRGKEAYNRQNAPAKTLGPNVPQAISEQLFTLKQNRLYFRDRPLFFAENTLYHLLSRETSLLAHVVPASREYFSHVFAHTDPLARLTMLKNLLQVMGWGKIHIIIRTNDVTITIQNPPHGLQQEDDDWHFLAFTILGCLQSIDARYQLADYAYTGATDQLALEYRLT